MGENMKKILDLWEIYKKDTILSESGFPRIIRMLSGAVPSVDSIAFITAENPLGQPLTKQENAERNKNLERALRDANYGFIKIRGEFGSPEKSYMIPNISRFHTIALGAEFDQEAVIWGTREENRMVFEYIEDGVTIQKRDLVLYTPDVQGQKDYFSQERQTAGRKFTIPFFDEEYEIVESKNAPVVLSELKHSSENQKIISEINARSEKLKIQNKIEKYYWHHRGILNVCLQKLEIF